MPSDAIKWQFEPVAPMGGATGAAFSNTLLGAGVSPEAELAREAIQNSCDAAKNGEQVRVVFRVVTINASAREKLLRSLSLQDIRERMRSLNMVHAKWLTQVTFVEDYGTVGLGGDPHQMQSNLHKLLLSVGDASKAMREGTAGSYGYGKSALSMNSRSRTIVAYSAFQKDETGATARLMGCAYFDAHRFNGDDCTGRGWFAVKHKRRGQTVYSPFENEEAHAIAVRLGFKRRAPHEHGTSLLILDSSIDHSKLLRGVTDWWWPRLLDQELDVAVFTDGKEHFPRPKQRADLVPFIECYGLASGKSDPIGKHQRAGPFNKLHGLGLGSFGLQLLTDEGAAEVEERCGTVALIRSPKMVVEYLKLGRDVPPAVGVFIADKDIDEILKLSEPPNHNRWDRDSPRLEQARPDEQTARQVIQQMEKRLRERVRGFQAEADPPRPRGERRLRFLERELGLLLQPSSRTPAPPQGEVAPIEVVFRNGPAAAESGSGKLSLRAKIAVRLREDAEENEMDAVLRVRVSVLEDDEGAEGDRLLAKLRFVDDVEKLPSDDEEQRFRVTLSRTQWITFSLQSDPYDAEWTTKVGVELEAPEAAS